MARHPRIKIPGHAAGYHIVSRVRGRQHLLDEHLKQHFIKLLHTLKTLYYVNIISYSILDNHYHLLVNFRDPEDIQPSEAIKRWNDYHAGSTFMRNAQLAEHRSYVTQELTDISSFMKRLNYHLTTAYNKRHNSTGTLWEGRYRSSVIERGQAIAVCASYIELNAFRASIVSKPETYAYSSLHHLKTGNPHNLINRELLDESLGTRGTELEELIRTYTAYVYQAGTAAPRHQPNSITITQAMHKELSAHNISIEQGSLSKRVVELIQGKVTGRLGYARTIYTDYIAPVGYEGRRAERHAGRWIRSLTKTLWTVCSTAARGSP